MAPIALFGMVWALKRGEHVRVDVLYERFPPRVKAVADIVACLLGLAVAAAIVWLSWRYVGPSFAQEEIPEVIARLLDVYLNRREEGESFLETYRRIGIAPFREAAYVEAD